MKFSTVLALFASQALQVLAQDSPKQCGDLGIMDTLTAADVPSGVDPKDARVCLEHPSVLEHTEHTLDKRACWYGRGPKCSKDGWCYTNCGKPAQNGKWCWLAAGGGFGDWAKCKNDRECELKSGPDHLLCGASKKGNCKSCGCSC